MGSAASNPTTEQCKRIDKEIAAERRQQKTLKLLLLGTAESGKSTVVKQMRILHDNGFSEDELRYRRLDVYYNLVHGMATILAAMRTFNLSFNNPIMESHAAHIVHLIVENEHVMQPSARTQRALSELWRDEDIHSVYNRRDEYQLDDCVQFFLDHTARICASNYTPTNEDILHTRVATTGIVQIAFAYKTKYKFRVFDVGGQRGERRKWIHCFDNVDAVIFVTAISEFDQVLREDENTNRLLESLHLFLLVINSTHFKEANVIVFLNKRDIFIEKIRTKSILGAFPEYTGASDYQSSVEHIESHFRQRVEAKEKKVYIHETCATDTNQVKLVIDSCMDAVITEAFQNAGVS